VSLSPKAAAVLLLEQLVTSFDFATNMSHAELVVHMGSVPFLISQLESKVNVTPFTFYHSERAVLLCV
jgi:hypothetical protein